MNSKKPHKAEKKKRERFKKEHPEGRKAWSKEKKHLITLSLIIFFFSLFSFGKNSYGYTTTATGATFDGTNINVLCEQLDEPIGTNSAYYYIGTTTDFYGDNLGATIGFSSCKDNFPTGITINATTQLNEKPIGTYYFYFGLKNDTDPIENINFSYVRVSWNGTTITNVDAGNVFYKTQFLKLIPSGITRATSTSNTLYADLYLKPEDYISGNYIRLKYVRQQALESAVASPDLLWTTLNLTDTITDGYNFVATTTGNLGLTGTYLFKAELRKPNTWWTTLNSWFNPFGGSTDSDIITSTTTTFIYGNMTPWEQRIASSTAKQAIDDFTASSTSTMNVKEFCSFSTSWDFSNCITALFLPTNTDITTNLDIIKNEISNKFPIGYFSDLIGILSTTTVGNLTILDAELPSALGLGKPKIQLNLAHVLDPVLNATTSQFSMSSSTGASSTATFFETTNYYWSIFIYILTALYILSRIIGSRLIPNI